MTTEEALSRAVETTALAYHDAYTSKATSTADVFDAWQAMMNACTALIDARKSDPIDTLLARLDGSGAAAEPWREPK